MTHRRPDWLPEFILDALRRDDEAQKRVQAWRDELEAESERELAARMAAARAAGAPKKQAILESRDGLFFVGAWQRARPAHLRPDTGNDPTVTERYARVLETYRDVLAKYGIDTPAKVREVGREADPKRRNRPRNRYYKGTRKKPAE